jgi:hypothetical protein
MICTNVEEKIVKENRESVEIFNFFFDMEFANFSDKKFWETDMWENFA